MSGAARRATEVGAPGDEPTSTREDWKNTVLAGLANYIDGGSIVAGAAGLALWAGVYGLSSSFVGVIAAFSSNAISAGVGALVGGRLCDVYGRKKIYQWTCCCMPSACCGSSSRCLPGCSSSAMSWPAWLSGPTSRRPGR